MEKNQALLEKLAHTVRFLSADAVQKAASGHPGMPMGTADFSAVLWAQFLKFNPRDPEWINRDRFVLSAGHGSMALYSMLHLFGFDLSLEQIKSFRQWGSVTPGHPEFGVTPGAETTTGPLGQGFANGVGLALSQKLLAERYGSELFNYRVYGIVSDGDLMEGISSEAASLAGHLGLNNLIYVYDDNHISIGGDTKVCFTESVPARFEAQGWFVQSVDGHDMRAVAACLEKARAEKNRPCLIAARTVIAKGSPKKAGTADSHGSPLGAEELAAAKAALGWSGESFYVPAEVREFCGACAEEKQKEYQSWQKTFAAWSEKNPARAAELNAQLKREIPAGLKADLLKAFQEPAKFATRELSGKALQVVARHLPFLVGGSADLEPSTKTLIEGSPDVGPSSFKGRNLRFGVREHAMGSLANGLAYTRAWIPYTATFLVFADYMRPAIRLAALSHLQSLFIFTHDSFWVGEDGPTHQPVEHIQSLRLIPNLHVFRPADGREVAYAYWAALQLKDKPSALLFSRQGVSSLELEQGANPEDSLRGAYVVSGKAQQGVVLLATGSEVGLAMAAAKKLAADGTPVRVVSMPCMELFLAQDSAFRDSILPPQSRKVVIEAGSSHGWERVVGDKALLIGLNHFGASAPGAVLAEKFGFTPEAVYAKVKAWL